ncbi:MAG: anaerobic ribonucleoside-triphosphate reductase activating protein [Methanomicrobiales archaeon]|nr:anaerobic ribonucleoside-triphosphate reductase activating protein [Methanomicrobiales archaeon]
MQVNFGGFIPLGTVDWYGIATCTVFLRGCPVRCAYCHNRDLQEGEDWRDVNEVLEMIRSSRMLVSGVVFSGGEPAMQKDPLVYLATKSREMELRVGVQTNGVFPETLQELIARRVVDRIALDVKARWERYDNLFKKKFSRQVQESLSLCSSAYQQRTLQEFEVVITLFRGYEDEVKYIASELPDGILVLQQGMVGSIPPLQDEELRSIADGLGMKVKIRTRVEGEVVYDGGRGRRATGKR